MDGPISQLAQIFNSQYGQFNRSHRQNYSTLQQADGLKWTMLAPGFMLDETSSPANAPTYFRGLNDTPLGGAGGLVATYDEVADLAVEVILAGTEEYNHVCVGVATGEQYWARLIRGMWKYYRPGLFS